MITKAMLKDFAKMAKEFNETEKDVAVLTTDGTGMYLGKMEDSLGLYQNMDEVEKELSCYFPEDDPFKDEVLKLYKSYRGRPVLFYNRWFKGSMFEGPTFNLSCSEESMEKDQEHANNFKKVVDSAVKSFAQNHHVFLMIENADWDFSINNQKSYDFNYDKVEDSTLI